MSDRHDVDPTDQELFRMEVGDVRRVRHDRIDPFFARRSPVPHMTIADERAVLEESLYGDLNPELETGEDVVYARPGLQNKVLRKLRRGQYAIGAQIDLHGMNSVQAKDALRCFIRDARRRGTTCVRVIHGKGLRSSNKGPVLKVRINRWLRHWDDVLAFCSARPNDGGTGAAYVLLRRPGP